MWMGNKTIWFISWYCMFCPCLLPFCVTPPRNGGWRFQLIKKRPRFFSSNSLLMLSHDGQPWQIWGGQIWQIWGVDKHEGGILIGANSHPSPIYLCDKWQIKGKESNIFCIAMTDSLPFFGPCFLRTNPNPSHLSQQKQRRFGKSLASDFVLLSDHYDH